MAIESVDFTIKNGDSIDVEFIVYDEDNVLVDLSTALVEYAAREYGNVTGDSVLSYSTADNISITGTGICSVSIDGDDTVDLLGKYQQALQLCQYLFYQKT